MKKQKMFLTEDESNEFLSNLHRLTKDQRRRFRRRLGTSYREYSRRNDWDIAAIMPESMDRDKAYPTLLQNMFFTACVFCYMEENAPDDAKPVSLEYAVAMGIKEQTKKGMKKGDNIYESSAARRFNLIQRYKPGVYSPLYKFIAKALKSAPPMRISYFGMLNELSNWDRDESVANKWARTFINVMKKKDKSVTDQK